MTLSTLGLTIRTQPEVQAEIETEIRASPALNPNGRINLAPTSVIGQLVGIVSAKIAELEEVLQGIYSAAYLASAEGASLDALAELVGVTRQPASASTVTLTVTGTNGTIVTAGSKVRDPDRPTIEWETLDSVTITIGTGTVIAQCLTTGVISANADTITEIVTPIAGWDTVNNDADASLGSIEETDAAMRERIAQLAFQAGGATTASIRSALYLVAGVTEAFVFENTSNVTDANGVPPHNIECVVEGGADNDIAAAILSKKAAGIGTYSATSDSGTADDANGSPQIVEFSRPVAVPVYVFAKVLHSGLNPDIAAEIKAAVAAFGDELTVGQDVIRSRFYSVIHSVSGVLNVQVLGISRTTMPTEGTATDDDVVMAFREAATFDTTDVDVTLEAA